MRTHKTRMTIFRFYYIKILDQSLSVRVPVYEQIGTMVATLLKKYEKLVPLTTSEIGDKEDERRERFHKIEEERMIKLQFIKKVRYMKRARPNDLLEGILYDIEYLGHQLTNKKNINSQEGFGFIQ